MEIITEQNLMDYAGVQQSNRLSQIVASVNAWVTAYTKRHFGNEEIIEETHDYAPVIFLREADIKTVDEVVINGTSVDVSELVIDKDTGRVRITTFGENRYGRIFFDAIKVKYKVGTANVPEDLKLATLQLAAEQLNRNDKKDANIASESVGGYSRSFTRNANQSGSKVVIGNANDYMTVFNFYKRGNF